MSTFTDIVGKKDMLRPQWVVKPSVDMSDAVAIRAAMDAVGDDSTFLRVRPDTQKLSEKVREGQHANRLKELKDDGCITVGLKFSFDHDWRVSRPLIEKTFWPDKGTVVTSKYVNFLLNPETYGFILEECDQDGAPLHPNSNERCGEDPRRKPPRPRARKKKASA